MLFSNTVAFFAFIVFINSKLKFEAMLKQNLTTPTAICNSFVVLNKTQDLFNIGLHQSYRFIVS